ncbi:MAG: FHA domain-containing protein [Lachnospiraceae bacterium]|nr:FHA domain-containing protein [Lachnospiraceae bacterium]
MPKSVWIILGIVAAIALVVVMRILSKKRARRREMEIQASDKLREEALDRIILNSQGASRQSEVYSAKPFEVNYDSKMVEKQPSVLSGVKLGSSLMVQIVENSELSARKYMFDPKQGIRIGSRQGMNNIVISSQEVDEVQCEILEHKGQILIRNVGRSGRVILERGKNRAYVEQNLLEMKSGDAIFIANMVYRVNFVKAN